MFAATQGPGDLDFLTWLPVREATDLRSSFSRAYEAIAGHLKTHRAGVLQERVFCDLATVEIVMAARTDVMGSVPTAQVSPTFIVGAPGGDRPIAGIHVVAARSASTGVSEVVRWQGTPIGRRIDGGEASYLGLSDVARLLPVEDRTAPGVEARGALQLTARLLDAEGWSFEDVCRTWFYLDDILSWYADFNSARNAVFTDLGLLNGSSSRTIPASTGIGGRNPLGHRCTLDLVAFRPSPGRRFTVEQLCNPLQNEAPDYGSAFSRGLAVATETCRTILVSGTASIDESGATVHPGDFDRQTGRTLDNVESLLASRGAGMNDICQATAFVKRPEDVARLETILRDRGLGDLPLVRTIDDVCREDLLVELDATAVIARQPASHG